MAEEKQKIDERVDEKIDDKIVEAQLPPKKSLNTATNIASKTTAEQDRRTEGQREINLIWERTQRHIALFVVTVACVVSAVVVSGSLVTGQGEPNALVLAAFTLLSNISFLVAGFYFGRTNHARIGDGKTTGLDDR